MSEQIKKTDFFAEDPFAEVKATMEQSLTVLTKYDEKLRNTAKSFLDIANSTKTATTDLTKLIEVEKQSSVIANEKKRNQKEISAIEKERENLKKNEEKLQAKLNALTSKEAENVAKLRLEISEQNKVMKEKLQTDKAATGSIDALNLANARLRKEVRALNLTTEEGRKRAAELNKQIDENTKIIKENVDNRLQQTMTVGDYSTAIKDALGQTGIFNAETQKMTSLFKSVSTVIKGTTVAQNGLNKVMAVSVFGAVLLVIGALVTYFSRFQKGMDLLSDSFAGVSAFVDVFLDALAKLGQQIFENIMPILGGLGDVIAGIVTLDYDRIKQGFDDVSNAVSNIDPINITELADEANRAAAAAFNLNGALRAVERSEKRFGLVLSQNNLKKKEALFYAKEESLSVEERLKFLKDAEKLTIEEGNQALFFAKAKLDLARENAKLAQNQEEAWQELSELEAEYYNVQAKVFEERKTFQRDILRLLREEQKIKEDLRKKEEEADKLLRDARVRNMIDEVNRNIQIEKNAYADRLNELRRQGLLSNELEIELKKEHDRKILELEAERTQKTLEEIDKRTVQNVPEATTGELDAVKDIEEQRVQIIVNAQNQIVKIYEQAAQRKIKALQDEQKAADDQLNSLKSAAKEGAILDEESIKDAEKRKREAIKEQKKVEKQQQRVQFIQLALQNITNQLKNGKSTGEALGSTFALQSALKTLFAGFEGFYKGTDNAPQGFAWVDEKGAEIHTDKHGNIKDFGSDKGARLKFLEQGDKIIPHEKSMQLLNDTLPTVKEKSSVKIDPTLDLLREQNRLLKNVTESKMTAEEIGSLLLVTTEDKKGNLSRINRYKYKR